MRIERSWPLILAVGLAAVAATAYSQDGTVTVHLANGEAVPLQEAQLTYEYQMWGKDTARVMGPIKDRESPAIVIGKDRYPAAAGAGFAFDHSKGRVQLRITQPSGKEKLVKNVKVPDRKVLLPDLGKDIMLQVRSLDLKGSTFTGTRRSFCLISFTSMVQCSTDAEHQVVRI